jgi:hypothetical protein
MAMKGRYPSPNCLDMKEEYANRRDAWMRAAIHEYRTNHRLLLNTTDVYFTGPF